MVAAGVRADLAFWSPESITRVGTGHGNTKARRRKQNVVSGGRQPKEPLKQLPTAHWNRQSSQGYLAAAVEGLRR